jgi:ABC-type transport system involved in Fe-S cluster assembly fused permease/ATPase subunit
MRMGVFNLGPILIEIVMTLIVFGTLFDWKFLVVELVSILIYLSATFYLTERRAGDFKE